MSVPRWQIATETQPIALITMADDTLALLSENGQLQPFDASGQEATPIAVRGTGAPIRCQDSATRGLFVAHNGSKHLTRLAAGRSSLFAEGASEIAAFRLTGEQTVIARADSIELWNQAGKQRWSHKAGPFVAVTVVAKLVVALHADGELLFLSMLSGSVAGRIKLEVPEPAHTWHLAPLEGSRLALALGEWLVIVDTAKEKVFRRARLRSRATALATTERRALVGLEDGWVQTVDALTGDIRGAFQVHHTPITALAIAKGMIVSVAQHGPISAWDEALLYGAIAAAAPITAIAAYGALVVKGDQSGRVRAHRGDDELLNARMDANVAFVHVAADESVTAVSSSLVVRWEKPWKAPKPLVLETPCTAFAADDGHVFSGNEHGIVDVFSWASQDKVTSYELSDAPIAALLRPRGNYLVVGTHALDGRLLVIDLAEGSILHRLEPLQEAFGVTCLAAEARGRMIAAGCEDGTIALIELAKGRVLAKLRASEAPVSLAFDGTGKRLVAVLADGAVIRFALDQKAAVSLVKMQPATCVASGDALVCGMRSGKVECVPPALDPR